MDTKDSSGKSTSRKVGSKRSPKQAKTAKTTKASEAKSKLAASRSGKFSLTKALGKAKASKSKLSSGFAQGRTGVLGKGTTAAPDRIPKESASGNKHLVLSYKSLESPSPEQMIFAQSIVSANKLKVVRSLPGLIRVEAPRTGQKKAIQQLDASLDDWDVSAEGTASLPNDDIVLGPRGE